MHHHTCLETGPHWLMHRISTTAGSPAIAPRRDDGARGRALSIAAVLIALVAPLTCARAEPKPTAAPPPDAWTADTAVDKPAPPRPANTTVIERKGDAADIGVKLVALLTIDGQQIDQGLVWRVFQPTTDPHSKSRLLLEKRDASPLLKLPPGDYTVNAAFGRANLTRKITVKPDTESVEQFVLNAGGLRLAALANGKPAPDGSVHYTIYSDDRDQFDNRSAVMTGAKPNLIIRLNAGIYRIVSTYGDANATIETDVTVEAGKLTEASLAHTGGKATLKLVTHAGGDAVPDTRWTIQNSAGETVKESVGALPTHLLAPGKYVAIAAAAGQRFKSAFQVKDGEVTSVEVMMTPGAGASREPPATGAPGDIDADTTLDFKNR